MQKRSKRLSPWYILILLTILVGFSFMRVLEPATEADTSQNDPAAILVTLQPSQASSTVQDLAPQKPFDYFVLSLSWAPDYCSANGNQDGQECATGKNLGFVLHGLWPQNTQGYPSNCSNEKLSNAVKAQFAELYPNNSLIEHEWEKHGTCTGLDPQQYFTLTRQISQSVSIPTDLKSPPVSFRSTQAKLADAFTAANPNLKSDSLAVYCSNSGRDLSELYICFGRDGKATSCSAEVNQKAAQSCNNSDFWVRNTH